MAGRLEGADRDRLARAGVGPLSVEDGLGLFDAALALGRPAVVPARLDMAALRGLAARDALPPPLRGLVRAPRTAAPGTGPGSGLAGRLAGLSEDERGRALLDLVRAEAAEALGHPSAGAVDAERGFMDQGFDSLTAVELRNRIGAAVGRRLPATLLFDHPTPSALAAHVGTLIAPGPAGPPPVLAELDRLEEALEAPLPDAAARDRLAVRLRSLLTRLDTGAQERAEGDGGIAEASDEEIFTIIDNELGTV
ncbi:hypothetical protein KLI87_30625 [Actinomadura sp. NEAU-AAG7]|nr:hypothetical protein [Actinomadura sp. NEAU-AAG7]